MPAPSHIEVEDNAIEMTRRSAFGAPSTEGLSARLDSQSRSRWIVAGPLALVVVGTLGWAASQAHQTAVEAPVGSKASLRHWHAAAGVQGSSSRPPVDFGIDAETESEATTKDADCSCPMGPSWSCTAKESLALQQDESICAPFAGKATCYCPPALSFWECSRERYKNLLNGTGCAYFSAEHNVDSDILSVRRAKAEFSQCRADVKDSVLTEAVCRSALQDILAECVASVKQRQAQGENIATGICELELPPAPEQLFSSDSDISENNTAWDVLAAENKTAAWDVLAAENETAAWDVLAAENETAAREVPVLAATAEADAAAEDHDCECPMGPSWKCTESEARSLEEDPSLCEPFTGRAACMCPPALAIRECSRSDFKELLNGTGCPFYSSEHMHDADLLAVRRAIAEFPQCLADVEGSKLPDKVCEKALQKIVDECSRSVKIRQAQGENIAPSICKVHASPMQQLLSASIESPEQFWENLTSLVDEPATATPRIASRA